MNRLRLVIGIFILGTVNFGWSAAPCPTVQPTPQTDALAIMFQVITQFKNAIHARDLSSIHNEDAFISAAVNELLAEATNTAPGKVAAFQSDLTSLSQRAGDLHTAADFDQQKEAKKELRKVMKAFDRVCSYFPKKLIAASQLKADVYICPMHPEVIGKQADICPKCGMALDQMVRILPSNADVSTAGQSIRASVRTDSVLTIGKPIKVFLKLTKADGFPVCLPDLIETHTKKIHMLVIDSSLTDYHHEHPEPTEHLGEYIFTFTPRKPGGYRLWADIRPYPLGLQEYVMTDIPALIPDPPLTNRCLNTQATVDGLHYELLLDTQTVKVGKSVHARLRITTTEGKGFNQLEPVMATFAHIVGFNEDYQNVMHIHPTGLPVLDAKAHGGPELDFQIYALQPGFVRLFAQVQINGKSRFAPFGIKVEP